MKQYRSEEEAGTLTDTRRLTANDISRTGTIAGSVGSRGATDDEGYAFEPTVTDDPLATLVGREREEGMRSGLRQAIALLTPIEATVVTRIAGLDGVEATTVGELASAGLTETDVRRVKERAMMKIRKHLRATRNPFFIGRN